MENPTDEISKIRIVAFSTDNKTYQPNYLITEYLKHHVHFIIKKRQDLIAFSTVLPKEKKNTKIILITIYDLNREYDGMDDVNCYLIAVELQKDYSKGKLEEILDFIDMNCSKEIKIFIFGIKTEENKNEEKINKQEIIDKLKDFNLEYEYFELSITDSDEISKKIEEVFEFLRSMENEEKEVKKDNILRITQATRPEKSCSII